MSSSALLRFEALRQCNMKQILCLESRMHGNVPVRFGRGRLDSLRNKGLAAYLIARCPGRGFFANYHRRSASIRAAGDCGVRSHLRVRRRFWAQRVWPTAVYFKSSKYMRT